VSCLVPHVHSPSVSFSRTWSPYWQCLAVQSAIRMLQFIQFHVAAVTLFVVSR
jgi:hypothetical protein